MSLAVLIPTYQARLDFYGQVAMEAAHEHLHAYDWLTFGPKRRYVRHGAGHIETPSTYWDVGDDGRQGYNPLMLARGLYEQLTDYTHVLVYQPDAIVFSDALYAHTAYDYIGAPNLSDIAAGRSQQGATLILNGGLSLRRVQACLRVLDGLAKWPTVESYYQHIACNEDVFWSDRAPLIERFRVAPLERALEFAWETDPAYAFLLNHRALPFGAHGYMRHSLEFWDNLGGIIPLALGPESRPAQTPASLAPAQVGGPAKSAQ